MLRFDIDPREVLRLERDLGATPRQVAMAKGRANKRTAATIRKLSSVGLQRELDLRAAKHIRRRVREYRVGGSGDGLKVWFGASDLPVSAFKGRPKAIPGGIQIGRHKILGAFRARYRGKPGIYERTGDGRYPIREARLPVADRMMVFLEDEVFIDVDSIWFKHFAQELRARTMLDARGFGG